jgi:toxin CptA
MMKVFLLALITVSLWRIVNQLKKTLLVLTHTNPVGWELSLNHHVAAIQILPSTVMTKWAVFLHFTDHPKNQFWPRKKSLLILSDSLNEENYRQLVVRLKTSFTAPKMTVSASKKI